MSDRFFLVSSDDDAPLIELVGVGSADQFQWLMRMIRDDRILASWGVTIDDGVPNDSRSVPPSDVNFVLTKVLMRRLLHHTRPHKFNHHGDPEKLREYLRHVWRV